MSPEEMDGVRGAAMSIRSDSLRLYRGDRRQAMLSADQFVKYYDKYIKVHDAVDGDSDAEHSKSFGNLSKALEYVEGFDHMIEEWANQYRKATPCATSNKSVRAYDVLSRVQWSRALPFAVFGLVFLLGFII